MSEFNKSRGSFDVDRTSDVQGDLPLCDQCGLPVPRNKTVTWVDPINWESMIICLPCVKIKHQTEHEMQILTDKRLKHM